MVTLAKMPTCPVRVAKGTWLWPYHVAWPETRVETFELTNYNYGVLFNGSLNADAIKVGPGHILSLRACNLIENNKGNTPGYWSWTGVTGTWNRDVQLDGGALYSVANQSFTLNGAITGTGDIYFSGGNLTTFSGAHAVTGTVYMSGLKLVFSGDGGCCPGSPESTIEFTDGTRGQIFFRPTGYASRPSEAYVKKVTGLSAENSIVMQKNQRLTVGAVEGIMRFENDTGSSLVVTNLAAGATMVVPDNIEITLLSAGAGAKVVFQNDSGTSAYRLNGPTDGSSLEIVAEFGTPASLTIEGRVRLATTPANLTSLTLLDGAELTGSLPESCNVRSLGGRLMPDKTSWDSKVALWCDASATRTLPNGAVTNTFIYANEMSEFMSTNNCTDTAIWKWLDRRPEQTRYAFGNKRYTESSNAGSVYSSAVLPFEKDVDGIHCVSMGDGAKDAGGTRRTAGHLNIFNLKTGNRKATISAAFAIAVFGSQSGCGGGVFGNADGYFASSNYCTSAADSRNCAIFTNACVTYVDGTQVDPTATKFSGGWQIISVDTEGKDLQGIGFCANGDADQPARRGYSSYAEVMIFSEKPTEKERRMIEEYLSAKWGIGISHSNTVQEVGVSGHGEMRLNEPTALSGTFSGTVDLNGSVLEIPAAKLPYTEAEIPDANRVMWFDPSFGGSLVMGGDAAKPLEIDAFKSRSRDGFVSSGKYLQSSYAADGLTDRRPCLAEGSRGGWATKWIDFGDFYGDGVNNVMMVRKLPYSIAPELYNRGDWATAFKYKTMFMVIDTSRGGGTPFPSWAGGGGGEILHRGDNPAVTDPIWSEGCADQVTNGITKLDGVTVDGTVNGFNGRPELISLTANPSTADISTKGLGCIVKNENQEIIGESIFYDVVLEGDVRAGIEAYLMGKWLGKVPEGYADFRGVTVTGAGTLRVPGAKYMPTIGVGFTGSVVLSADTLSFAFDGSSTVASNAMSLPGTDIAFPAEVAVNLSFASSPSPGVRYTLIAGDIDVSATEFTLGTVSGAGNRKLSLAYDGQNGELYVEAKAFGFVFSIK